MLVSFPALFYYDDSESVPYYVSFPDFKETGTQGKNISDAIEMASDWLGLRIADYIENGLEVPTPSLISHLSLEENNPFKDDEEPLVYNLEKSFISMVSVDIRPYLENNEPIKKTLTIPKWADKVGRDMKLNFSKTLTEAIAEKMVLK